MYIQFKFLLGCALLVIFAILHLLVGSTSITLSDFFDSLLNYDVTNTNHIIARDLRIPRTIITFIAGAGLSVAGMLMQTVFINPLAEPNILGVSTGASLFVALTLLSGITFFHSDFGLISSALVGSFVFGIIVLFFARFVRSHGSLLIVGIMLGSFSGSFIGIIQAWSDANQLKQYSLWALGSLQNVTFEQLPIVIVVFLIGTISCFFLIRSLNALVLGHENASTLGINVKNTRILAILIAAILTGLITAYCGPIAFIGMAVPNLVKIVFRTHNHTILIIGSILIGGVFLLVCDCIVQFAANYILLPINAITSLIGAPFVVYIILKRWS